MAEITLSSAVRRNLLSLQDTAMLMGKTQERLATGKKVNSALDNPTNFFTAAALSSRSSDLSRLLDSVSNAVQTLEAADNGIKAITKLVESAQATARQALQSPADVVNATNTGSDTSPSIADDADDLTININGTDTVFDLSSGDTAADVASTINDADAGLRAEVVDGALKITANDGGAFTVAAGDAQAELGLATGAQTSTVTTDSATRENLEKEFNDLLLQIDTLTKDAGYNGNNLLANDSLKVIFNEDGSSSITIGSVDISASGLGLSATTDGDFQKNVDINDVLATLDSALLKLRSQASTFGSNLSVVQTRQDFTKNMMNTLETGAANLTLADINMEGANMLALQTRQQLSTTALSMASQADQSVLSLF